MKVLCTGGAGYVGSTCLRWLRANGHEAVAYDNLSLGHREAVGDATLIVGDISDTVVEGINKIGSVFYGPVLAAFVIGVVSKRATAQGVMAFFQPSIPEGLAT